MSANAANIVSLTQQGRPTDQETKDEAFRLWVELGRSWKAVSDRSGIPVRTLHEWGHVDNWQQRRVELASAFMPGKKTETAIALRLAGHSSAVKLQQMAYESVEYGTPLDYRQVDAHTKIVAMAGYSSVGARDPLSGLDTIHSDTKPTEANDLTGKSPDELSRLEDSHRAKRRIVTSEDQRRPPR